MRQNLRVKRPAALAGLAGMLPDVSEEAADPAEVARALRAVVEGVTRAPDTTADPAHLAYLCGWADALDRGAMTTEGESPEANESGLDSRDTSGGGSAQDTESR